MLELVVFVYSNVALTAALTIGAWTGAFLGAIAGGVVFYKYMRWCTPHGVDPLSLMLRFINYTAFSAVAILTVAIGVVFGSVLGSLVLFLAWVVLLPALVGGLIGLAAYVLRRRKVIRETTQIHSNTATFAGHK